jgi:RecJ-like exonuclease
MMRFIDAEALRQRLDMDRLGAEEMGNMVWAQGMAKAIVWLENQESVCCEACRWHGKVEGSEVKCESCRGAENFELGKP